MRWESAWWRKRASRSRQQTPDGHGQLPCPLDNIPTGLYTPLVPLMRGASRGRSGSGAGCGACGRGSHPRTREAGGRRPGLLRGSAAICRLDAGQVNGGNAGVDGKLPEARHVPGSTVPRTQDAATARRKATRAGTGPSQAVPRSVTIQVAPFGASSPSCREGKTGGGEFARWRESDGAWLFDIRIGTTRRRRA
jgi:hypothetical protein